jgi:hypothetical protein
MDLVELWAVMIADVGYTVTFGRHDPTILARSHRRWSSAQLH